MAGQEPRMPDNALYRLLREEKIDEANALIETEGPQDLSGAFLRGLNLKGLHADGLDFTNAYFRLADLRGLDLRHCPMEGASIHGAKIHGVYFPPELDANEILLSLNHGTRMRYRR